MELWVQILSIVLAAVVPTGGVSALFMVRGKRMELEISNLTRIIEHWQGIAKDRELRADELKADLDKRDAKIDSLYAVISGLRVELDHERTARAVASMMICNKMKCTDRNPPFGQGIEYLNETYELRPILPDDTGTTEQ